MSYGYFVFDVLLRDLTADEESWIEDQCTGEFDTCHFIHEFMAEYDEVINRFYWPKGVRWPYEDYAPEFQEGEIPFVDFEWEIVRWDQENRHLRIRDNHAVEPPLQTAELIRRFLQKWRPNDTFSLQYSIVSSHDDGSPGAFHITAERVEWMSVGRWLMQREEAWQSACGRLRCQG
jgi:hypothetical protein